MLNIDEAIAHAREVAKEQRKDNENCKYKSEYGCKGCADYYSKPCIECAEEHEQLAELLEELKILREEKSEFQIIAKDIAEYNYEMGMENGYNKAIDDFVESLKEKYACCGYVEELAEIDIDEIAEQLKAGETE